MDYIRLTKIGLLASLLSFTVFISSVYSGADEQKTNQVLRNSQANKDITSHQAEPFLSLLLAQKVKSTKIYTEDHSLFLNPERGFHGNADILNETDLSWIRAQGYSLARAYIRLDDYRNQPLPASFLANVESSLNNARNAGIKIILRFSYNFGIGEADAPLDRVEEHIIQLTPVLHQYQDVIAVLQAGFIGAWGEWHNSSNGLDTKENKAKVLTSLLSALPASRMVQLRYPGDLIDNFPQPLRLEEAYSGTNKSRVGHHNDCFLSSDNDVGTYWPTERMDEFKTYLDQSTKYTPTGGETCQVTPEEHRTDCETSLAEMARFHWNYLNHDFYAPDINRWKSEGCYEDISRRLGYRYRLLQVEYSDKINPGENLDLELSIANDGFGSLYNPRPLQIILTHAESNKRAPFTVTDDVRKLLPPSGESNTISASISLPENMAKGEYEVFLNLPDASPALSSIPEYSIRLANSNIWQANTGYNQLGFTILIK